MYLPEAINYFFTKGIGFELSSILLVKFEQSACAAPQPPRALYGTLVLGWRRLIALSKGILISFQKICRFGINSSILETLQFEQLYIVLENSIFAFLFLEMGRGAGSRGCMPGICPDT